MKLQKEIRFHISGEEHTVKTDDVPPDTTLNTYLRDKMHLTATKKMCLEGGCGTCIVAVERVDNKGVKQVLAINSCLVSIFSCHGWKILTNEGIGNPTIGYHKIQQTLADNNGSQCGFCSSGMVMNMYALLESGPKTKAEIENSFGGNICRCTGYRAILTAFKKFASDADPADRLDDIEDIKPCKKLSCSNDCKNPCSQSPIFFELGNSRWVKVHTLTDLLNTLKTIVGKTYQLVAGNTARGVYWPTTTFDVYIDIASVTELTASSLSSDSLILGGNCSLTFTMDKFREVAATNPQFSYLSKMADHLDLVAHIPVRNIGTIAGNLMTKYQHPEFPSDVFLILETVNASVVIVDLLDNQTVVSPKDFLKVDMKKKVIKEIILDAFDSTYSYSSYKIMPRAQNAHAMLNAGFQLRFSNTTGNIQIARIVYGAINPTFIHATETEKVLMGKNLFDNDTLQLAFKTLNSELIPDWVLPDPKPEFRKQLAINLFYKYVLSIAPSSKVNSRYRSGGTLLSRPISTGSQQIYPKKDLYPLTQPIIKLEALAQTSGQAKYVVDLPDLPGQLHAVLVQARAVPQSTLVSIDSRLALTQPGVVAFYSVKDVPGINNFAAPKSRQNIVEKVFCDQTVQYYSQPAGVLVATSHDAAKAAAGLVKVITKPPAAPSKPVLTIRDVLDQNITSRITHNTAFAPKGKGTDIKTIINGETNLEGQYHYHMETQTVLTIPIEDGLDVYASSQWMDHVQGAISQFINMPSQKINIQIKRLGGGFGAKVSRTSQMACATALASYKLKQPVRMWMNFDDNMDIVGKRFPCLCRYKVGVNATGVIQYLEAKIYSDLGVGGNEIIDFLIVGQFQNGYAVDYWTFDTYSIVTDNPAYCFMRAPGNCEAISCIEAIMDHIAHKLNLDPVAVRKANLKPSSNSIVLGFLQDIETSDEIQQRKAAIQAYNQANRWNKKGLSIVPMTWNMELVVSHATLVSIYHLDGGVAISHGGIEMGQGINTKVAQVCAYKFNIPIEKVSVKPSYNVIAPNNYPTGASLASEGVVYALLKACDVLLDRIKPIRDKNPKASWEELIQLCFVANINLSSNGYYSPTSPGVANYPIYGCCALELEVDILTGKHEVTRVDVIEDVGQSMSPLIDIGQLEGALVIGMGYHSSEELILDKNTGRLTNNRTWNYKPYGAKDIPADFRVKFSNNTFNPVGILNSKAIAEPPVCLSVSLPLALRMAVGSARAEANAPETWYPIDGPTTVDNVLLNTLNNFTQYRL